MININRVLRKAEVIAATGLSNTSLFERTKQGLFPTSISLGGRAVGFLENEVNAVVTARAAGYDDEQIKELVVLLKKKRKESAEALMSFLAA